MINIDMSAAKNIRKLRITMCMGVDEFAQKLGIHRASVFNYERGLRVPRFPTIRKLRELAKENGLEFSVEDFLEKD